MEKIAEILELPDEVYKNFKNEVTSYFNRYKGKRLTIYTIDYDPLQFSYECIYKIKPILSYIAIRNMHPEVTVVVLKLLSFIDTLEIENYVKRLNLSNEYANCIIEGKLMRIISEYNAEIRYLVCFMFNLQPIMERKVSQNVVGFGKDEYETVMSEDMGVTGDVGE